MMKSILAILLTLFLFSTISHAANVYYDGTNDLVALSTIKEWLDIKADRNGANITLSGKGKTVRLVIGNPLAIIDGKTVKLTTALEENDGVLFAPASLLAKLYGVKVEWELDEYHATLTCPGKPKPLVLTGELERSKVLRDLQRVISQGRLPLVKKYMQQYPQLLQLTSRPGHYDSPLDYAICRGQLEIVSYLLQNGVKLPAANTDQAFMLMKTAVSSNNPQVLDLLVNKGLIPKVNGTLLHEGCSYGNLAVVKWLVEHGAEVNAVMGLPRNTEMDVAPTETDDPASVDTYLRDDPDVFGRTSPLACAISSDSGEVAEYLLTHGVKPNLALTEEKLTALHLTALRGSQEMAAILIKHGADINTATKSGFTPLHLACLAGNAEMAALLLDKKARTDGIAQVPPVLLAIPADQAKKLPGFGTPLMFAVLQQDEKLLKALSEHGMAVSAEEARNNLFMAFWVGKRKSRISSCISNLRQLALSAQMYVQENEEIFPPKDGVWKDLLDIEADTLRCPEAPDRANGYGYNVVLSGLGLGKVENPCETILFADCKSADNLLRTVADVDLTRHGEGYCAAFVDGHVEFIRPVDLQLKKAGDAQDPAPIPEAPPQQ